MEDRIAIIDGVRTPFLKSGGKARSIGAVGLGVCVVKELMVRFPQLEVDEVIVGNVAQPANALKIF